MGECRDRDGTVAVNDDLRWFWNGLAFEAEICEIVEAHAMTVVWVRRRGLRGVDVAVRRFDCSYRIIYTTVPEWATTRAEIDARILADLDRQLSALDT